MNSPSIDPFPLTEATTGFYLTAHDTICYVDEDGCAYHPNPHLRPSDAEAYGIPYVQCDEGVYYYRMCCKVPVPEEAVAFRRQMEDALRDSGTGVTNRVLSFDRSAIHIPTTKGVSIQSFASVNHEYGSRTRGSSIDKCPDVFDHTPTKQSYRSKTLDALIDLEPRRFQLEPPTIESKAVQSTCVKEKSILLQVPTVSTLQIRTDGPDSLERHQADKDDFEEAMKYRSRCNCKKHVTLQAQPTRQLKSAPEAPQRMQIDSKSQPHGVKVRRTRSEKPASGEKGKRSPRSSPVHSPSQSPPSRQPKENSKASSNHDSRAPSMLPSPPQRQRNSDPETQQIAATSEHLRAKATRSKKSGLVEEAKRISRSPPQSHSLHEPIIARPRKSRSASPLRPCSISSRSISSRKLQQSEENHTDDEKPRGRPSKRRGHCMTPHPGSCAVRKLHVDEHRLEPSSAMPRLGSNPKDDRANSVHLKGPKTAARSCRPEKPIPLTEEEFDVSESSIRKTNSDPTLPSQLQSSLLLHARRRLHEDDDDGLRRRDPFVSGGTASCVRPTLARGDCAKGGRRSRAARVNERNRNRQRLHLSADAQDPMTALHVERLEQEMERLREKLSLLKEAFGTNNGDDNDQHSKVGVAAAAVAEANLDTSALKTKLKSTVFSATLAAAATALFPKMAAKTTVGSVIAETPKMTESHRGTSTQTHSSG